jgi:hemoglobin
MSGRGAAAYPVAVNLFHPVPVALLREAPVAPFGPGTAGRHRATTVAPTCPATADAPTGFDLIGGQPAVRDAVGRWLRLVAADGGLAPYLVGVDLSRLAGHLALLLTTALGGPAGDIARPVVGAWRGLGLTEAHHRRVVDYLTGVLWAMDLPAADIARVGQAFAAEAAR